MRKGWEQWDHSAWRSEGSGRFIHAHKYLTEEQRQQSQTPLSGAQWQDKMQWAQIETREIPLKCEKKLLRYTSDHTQVQAGQRYHGVSIFGYIQISTGHGNLLSWTLLWAEAWTRWSPEVHPRLSKPLNLWKYINERKNGKINRFWRSVSPRILPLFSIALCHASCLILFIYSVRSCWGQVQANTKGGRKAQEFWL